MFQACDDLQIFCSSCTPTQLASLKLARVLPISATQCGLITKSDAERLCTLLLAPTQRSPLSSPPPPPYSPTVSPPRGDQTQFRVQHRCFGECVGILHPQSYTSPGAKCIGRAVSKERFKIRCVLPLSPSLLIFVGQIHNHTHTKMFKNMQIDPKISKKCVSYCKITTQNQKRRTCPPIGQLMSSCRNNLLL